MTSEIRIIGLLISAAVFLSYVTWVAVKYGIQNSISESYYRLDFKNKKYIFAGVIWGFAVPVMYAGDNALMFLAGGTICFVGGAAAFKKNRMEKWVHMSGAIGGIILGMLSLIINYDNLPFVLMAALISAVLYFNATNKIWWIEIVAFLTIWLGILLNVMM